jgi:hypothetical protein
MCVCCYILFTLVGWVLLSVVLALVWWWLRASGRWGGPR